MNTNRFSLSLETTPASDDELVVREGLLAFNVGEAHAVEQGCVAIRLDTLEFQALPFYEKLGYQVFGVLDGYPPGYRQYHLSKQLRAHQN